MGKKSKLSTLGSGLAQGGTLGFADEITNSLGAILAKVLRPDLFEDQSLGEVYREGMDASQANIAQHKKDNPKTQTLGEVLGAVLNPVTMAAGGAVAKGGAGIGRAMGMGAAEGAAYGFGTGYGTEDRLKGAATDGAIGAVSAGGAKLLMDDIAKSGGFKKWLGDETGAVGFNKKYGDVLELDDDITLWHGTPNQNRQRIIKEGLIPSSQLGDDVVLGGGYGTRQHGVSLSGKQKTAANFATTKDVGTVFPVKVAKGAKIAKAPKGIEYAEDITEEMLQDLKKEGIDGLRLPFEDEVVMLSADKMQIQPSAPFQARQASKMKFDGFTDIDALFKKQSPKNPTSDPRIMYGLSALLGGGTLMQEDESPMGAWGGI